MKTRVIITIVFVSLGLIMAAVPQNKTNPKQLSAKQLLAEAHSQNQYFTPDQVADLVIKKDPSFQLIDVRSLDAYEKFHLPGAVNIPLTDILDEQWTPMLNQSLKMNIFYSNGTVDADKAWMITRQLGYKNNYVMQGGMNYWAETIMNPKAPASTSPNEEFAKYDFHKGAGQALGGGVKSVMPENNVEAPKPVIPKAPRKKRVQGGC